MNFVLKRFARSDVEEVVEEEVEEEEVMEEEVMEEEVMVNGAWLGERG